MKAFITGSREYGTPRKDSDVDLVVHADRGLQRRIRKLLPQYVSGDPDYENCTLRIPARDGALGVDVIMLDAPRFIQWDQVTRSLKGVSLGHLPGRHLKATPKPVSREDAKVAFREAGTVVKGVTVDDVSMRLSVIMDQLLEVRALASGDAKGQRMVGAFCEAVGVQHRDPDKTDDWVGCMQDALTTGTPPPTVWGTTINLHSPVVDASAAQIADALGPDVRREMAARLRAKAMKHNDFSGSLFDWAMGDRCPTCVTDPQLYLAQPHEPDEDCEGCRRWRVECRCTKPEGAGSKMIAVLHWREAVGLPLHRTEDTETVATPERPFGHPKPAITWAEARQLLKNRAKDPPLEL